MKKRNQLTSRKPQLSQPKSRSNRVQKIDLLKGTIIYDNVLVQPFFVEETGGIARPQQYEDKPEWGEVIVAGEGRLFDNGTLVPLKVKAGDLILFQKYSAQKFRHNGEDFIIIREEDIHFVNR